MKKNSSFDLLFETGLRHQYKAELEILKTLPTMIENARDRRLREAFQHHYKETEDQVKRLEKVFRLLDIDPSSSKVKGMKSMLEQGKEVAKTVADLNFSDTSKGLHGIVSEGSELIRHFGSTEACDFSLASAGRKVEHFEIACYESLILLAESYGLKEIAELLKESLEEELHQDELLDEIAHDVKLPAKAA